MTAAGIETEKCPKCEQVVYDAEGFPAGKKLGSLVNDVTINSLTFL